LVYSKDKRNSIRKKIKQITGAIFGALGVVGSVASYVGFGIGWLYWVYLGVKLGSFIMVIVALLGPVALIVSVIGLWSFIFGVPDWIIHLFA
jgi:phage-related minor tail protein